MWLVVKLILAVFALQECFQDKDYLNQRYSVKRALYLAHLAFILRKSDLIQQVSYSHHHGNRLKPVLLIKPAGLFYCVYVTITTPT